jgi:hypothetical protein
MGTHCMIFLTIGTLYVCPKTCLPTAGSLLNSFSALTQFSMILPVFAAALKRRLMSSMNGGFERPIMATSLVVSTGAEEPAPAHDVDYLPYPETLILICFGLDSSRLAICRVKTPLRYSARMLSAVTVFGREKLRVKEP